MNILIRKKIILHLLDCTPKPANEIAAGIDESLTSIENQLTVLVSENICEKINRDEIKQYVVKKDIETFARLVKAFLSDKEEHKEEIGQFVSSDYYFSRIDNQLVDYVLRRFYLDSAYQTDEDKLPIGRILLASPSALLFALYGDTTVFSGMMSSSDQLDSSHETWTWFNQILHSTFMTPLLEMLIADMKVPTYGFLYAKLQLMAAKIDIRVNLATTHGKYVEAMAGGSFGLSRAAEDLKAGQLTSPVNPISLSNYGLAFLHLGEFQTALENFDKALNAVQYPSQKAIVLNNKGLTFLRLKQYQRAIECFKEGIAFDSEGEISELRENKQITEEYLAIATDADNLIEPTRIRFVQNQPVPFEETRLYEFKEVKGRNSVNRITKDSDEYAVAFLNRKGGRIFWGIRDSDRITVGVSLNERQRDEVRRKVSEKLWAIRPPVSDDNWQLEFHNVYNFQRETMEDLWVLELVVRVPQERDVFYTSKWELHVKTEGGKQKLLGPQVTEFIRGRLQDETGTT
ncbi:MAG: putative DNA binding domain-containing protein [Candidatus Poribacteria bacterium]|nr:putative DNA binding domain-containing protein [Candidatus Poribacteria bacterium]